MSQPRLDRIAIVMMSAAGDAVHTLPVVNALRRHRPRTHITWILQPGPATLVHMKLFPEVTVADVRRLVQNQRGRERQGSVTGGIAR